MAMWERKAAAAVLIRPGKRAAETNQIELGLKFAFCFNGLWVYHIQLYIHPDEIAKGSNKIRYEKSVIQHQK